MGLHFTPPQMLRRDEQCSQGGRERGGGGLKLRLVLLEAWSITFLHCLSVVSICGIESEFYYLQIAGHKHPNSISGARALEISFLLVQVLQGPTFFTLFSITGTDCLRPAHGEVVPDPFCVLLQESDLSLIFQNFSDVILSMCNRKTGKSAEVPGQKLKSKKIQQIHPPNPSLPTSRIKPGQYFLPVA